MTQNDFSDQDLVAFDDGQLSGEKTAQLRDCLSRDLELQARLAALKLDRDGVAGAFDKLLDLAPKQGEFSRAPVQSAPALVRPAGMAIRPLAAAACLVMALIAGAAGYRALAPAPATMAWQDLAAAYHALYVGETLAVIAPPEGATKAAQFTRAETALGQPISRALGDIPGLSFRRVQVLGFDDQAIIQLAYLGEDGVPYALCLRKVENADNPAMQPMEFAGVDGVGWQSGGLEIVLLGKRDQGELNMLAKEFARNL